MLYRVENLSFSYDQRKVIGDLSVNIGGGKFYGILGPNGCGKTTFLDLLVKAIRPDSGKIFYKGESLASWPAKKIAGELALVEQNYNINFPFSVKEVVMMGRHPYIDRFRAPSDKDFHLVEEVMKQAGVHGFKNRLITELSGGERQRVVFARALAQDTPVLFLDEATSNLDINHSLSLLNRVKEGVEKKGRTVISVFQDINLAALYCDHLIFMKNGTIAAEGPTESVLNSETLKEVFHVNAMVRFEPYSGSNQVVFKN